MQIFYRLKMVFERGFRRIFIDRFRGHVQESAIVRVTFDDRDPDSLVQLRCLHRDCAHRNRDSMDCNCKHILIAEDGSCKTFIPFGEKHGEFPL